MKTIIVYNRLRVEDNLVSQIGGQITTPTQLINQIKK